MERLRRRRAQQSEAEAPPRSGAAGSIAADEAFGPVTVISGSYSDAMELAGMTVSEAFRLLSSALHLAPGVNALVDGSEAGGDHRLGAGQTLEFVRAAGEKGS